MTAFNIDRFTTSGAPDHVPADTLGARATTVLVEPPGTSWSAAERCYDS
jgi:hypothetical protein